jgi:hypothetical protein
MLTQDSTFTFLHARRLHARTFEYERLKAMRAMRANQKSFSKQTMCRKERRKERQFPCGQVRGKEMVEQNSRQQQNNQA